MGAHIALEEAGASFDTTEGLKVGLMGPLAGVGDTLVWALYNSIIFSICSSMALAAIRLPHPGYDPGILPLHGHCVGGRSPGLTNRDPT